MPSITSGKVLVTGANGFIAIWVVQTLLQKGYSVRGAVRSESKAKHLRTTFASYGDKFEIAIVPEITKEGAFDEAVKDVDAIEHVASPVIMDADDPSTVIEPAVNGTLRILEAALAHGRSVKRVVVTSSVAAILQMQDTPRVFTEADWNDQAVAEVETKGRAAVPVAKYCASKVLAERAAWDFVEKNRDRLQWDLVVLHPPFVFGPVKHEAAAPAELNETMRLWFQVVFSDLFEGELGTRGEEWIDVRDLAEAHTLALQTQKAAGQRIVISNGPYKWQDWINTAQKYATNVRSGDKSYDPKTATHPITFDTSKAKDIFGIEYRSKEQTTRDIIEDFETKGWVSVSR